MEGCPSLVTKGSKALRASKRLAPAVTLAVAEPHAFLRHGLGAYLELAADERYVGSYVGVDGELEPV
jgi:hypothetical protein